MAEFRIYDWKGTPEELQSLLEKGIKVTSAEKNRSGTCVKVSYEPKESVNVGRPAKYTDEQLNAMYEAYMTSDDTFAEIGKRFGCSRTYVSKVVNQIAKKKGIDLEMERNAARLEYWLERVSQMADKKTLKETSVAYKQSLKYAKLLGKV